MYKILIADDEAMIREGIKYLCDYESLGYSIVGEAASGTEAYEKILSLNPDVVMLDIKMPGMTGLEVIEKLNEQNYSGKIVIVSSYSDFSYAQQAIKLGVQNYITKPIDEDELSTILTNIKETLDAEQKEKSSNDNYKKKAYDAIVKDILTGEADFPNLDLEELRLNADKYQVVTYEKYSYDALDAAYNFSELLRVTNDNNNSFDAITMQNVEVILLKGEFAIQQFNNFLERFQRERRPQKNSPLDSLFITYGSVVTSLLEIPKSYDEANILLSRRFFCDQEQHTIGYMDLPSFENNTCIISDELLDEYTELLLNYLQAFNRNMVAETLTTLQSRLYNAADSIDAIKLFLTDLYLRIKEQMNHLYPNYNIPFANNSEIIRLISDKYFLYEIILYFTEQFEIIMGSIGNTSRNSVLEDILHYINHNYTQNITLENIAPLFGYNSSYLGKIFSKKVGENFNSYIDHIRIEHSKQLLINDTSKVYVIAEQVGYRSVDYFHIKFKKYVGMSPAEFRKKNKAE